MREREPIHLELDDEARGTAALFALSALEQQEQFAYETHLEECGLCRREVQSLKRAVEALSLMAVSAEPSPRLKERLLRRLETDSKAASEAAARQAIDPRSGLISDRGIEFLFAQNAVWRDTGIHGITIRPLQIDREKGRITTLARFAPGTVVESHDHSGLEECLVIDGELMVGERILRAGDYQAGLAGSQHVKHRSTSGCTCLLIMPIEEWMLLDQPSR